MRKTYLLKIPAQPAYNVDEQVSYCCHACGAGFIARAGIGQLIETPIYKPCELRYEGCEDRDVAGGALRTVWKFELDLAGEQELTLPAGATILVAGVTGQPPQERPCVWAIVDPDAPREQRRFRTYGTGHPIAPDATTYVGSYKLAGGAFVGHLFEVGRE